MVYDESESGMPLDLTDSRDLCQIFQDHDRLRNFPLYLFQDGVDESDGRR